MITHLWFVFYFILYLQAVFDVHDRVANREYLPVLPDILPQCDDEEIAVKIVKLIKINEPLVSRAADIKYD